MAVPAVPTFDDWAFELVNLSDGTFVSLNESIIAIEGWAGRGATTHRLESAHLEIPSTSIGADYIDFDNLQLLRIVPYGDATRTLWGVIVKDHESYSERGIRDPIKITLAPIEYLLHSRVVFHKANAGADVSPISGTTVAADDYLKDLVSGCTTGVDADGDARTWDWGTLAIAGDLSAAGNVTMGIVGGFLDEAVDAIAKSQDVDWELRPSVSGGVVTFTFSTAYPRGGTDKSSGASRVIINDIGAMVPRGERYFDREGMATAMYARGFADVEKSTNFATLGRWENATDLEDADALKAAMSRMTYKSGSTFGFEAAATAGQCRWMAEYEVGDLVARNNVRLGVSASNEEINGIKFSFPNRVLQLEIRWGNKEPTNTSKRGGGVWKPPPTDMEWYAAYVTPVEVGGANAEGSDETKVRGDHVHKGVIQVAAIGEAAPAVGIITFTSSGSTITLTRPAGDTVNFEAAIGGACLWQDSGTYYYTRYGAGNDRPVIIGRNAAPSERLEVYDASGSFTQYDEGTYQGRAGIESGGIFVIDTQAVKSISFRPNQIETVHVNTGGVYIVNSLNLQIGVGAIGAFTRKFTVWGADGNTEWATGAQWIIEGDTYSPPTAYPASSGMALVGTNAGVLSWAWGRTAALVQVDAPGATWIGQIWVDI